MADSTQDPAATRAERRGATAAVGIFVVLSSFFVLSSAWQLCRGVFFLYDPTSSLHVPSLNPAGDCARELRTLADAIERGISASRLAPTALAAGAAFEAGLSPDWDRQDAVFQTCSGEASGVEAFATVARLRRAGEAFARHRASDLAKPHEDVAVALGTAPGAVSPR